MAELCRQTGYFSWLVCTNPHANLMQVSKPQSAWSGEKSLFPERQKPSADKMPSVTRLVSTCCRDSSFISRMFWIPIWPIHDLLQHHLFQCGCRCMTEMQAATQQQQLCRAPVEPAETSEENESSVCQLWRSWHYLIYYEVKREKKNQSKKLIGITSHPFSQENFTK